MSAFNPDQLSAARLAGLNRPVVDVEGYESV